MGDTEDQPNSSWRLIPPASTLLHMKQCKYRKKSKYSTPPEGLPLYFLIHIARAIWQLSLRAVKANPELTVLSSGPEMFLGAHEIPGGKATSQRAG